MDVSSEGCAGPSTDATAGPSTEGGAGPSPEGGAGPSSAPQDMFEDEPGDEEYAPSEGEEGDSSIHCTSVHSSQCECPGVPAPVVRCSRTALKFRRWATEVPTSYGAQK